MGMQQEQKAFRQSVESRKSMQFQNSPLDFGMPSRVPFSRCKCKTSAGVCLGF